MNFALGEDIRKKYLLALLISLSFSIALVEHDLSDTISINNHNVSYAKCVGDNDDIVYGCTDPNACNYDPVANVDDGSCVYHDCDDGSTFSSTGLTCFTTL